MIEIKKVSKAYRKNEKVIKNIDLKINDGEIFGFLGPNGAGKTTTIKMIIKNPIEPKKQIGLVTDNPDMFLKLKGIEYLNFIADMYEIEKEVREKRILALAKEFGIYEVLGDKIQSYSHGMRQKIAIIAVLLHNPKNWILEDRKSVV